LPDGLTVSIGRLPGKRNVRIPLRFPDFFNIDMIVVFNKL
jgi:hypothetical protein